LRRKRGMGFRSIVGVVSKSQIDPLTPHGKTTRQVGVSKRKGDSPKRDRKRSLHRKTQLVASEQNFLGGEKPPTFDDASSGGKKAVFRGKPTSLEKGGGGRRRPKKKNQPLQSNNQGNIRTKRIRKNL